MFSELMSGLLTKGQNAMNAIGNNPLALQYMAAAGSDLLSGNPIGANVNNVTMNTIRAKSYANMLSKMLESGGKLSIDANGGTLKFPAGVLSQKPGMPGEPGTPTPNAPMADINQPQPAQPASPAQMPSEPSQSLPAQSSNEITGQVGGINQAMIPLLGGGGMIPGAGNGIINPMMAQYLNPSSSPLDFSYSDLAGLTPQDITSAMNLKMTSEEMKNKQISSYYDNIYKLALINQANAKATKTDPKDEMFPIPVPGIGAVTLRQWSELPTDQKQYAAYVSQAVKLGDSDIMSKNEFENMKPTDREKFYRALLKDPKLMEVAKELKPTTNIDIGQRTTERIKAEQQAKISGPGYVDSVLTSMKKDGRAWRNPANTEAFFNQKLGEQGLTKDNLTKDQELALRKDARKLARVAMLYYRIKRDLNAAYGEENVENRSDGIYANGKKIIGIPINANLD